MNSYNTNLHSYIQTPSMISRKLNFINGNNDHSTKNMTMENSNLLQYHTNNKIISNFKKSEMNFYKNPSETGKSLTKS